MKSMGTGFMLNMASYPTGVSQTKGYSRGGCVTSWSFHPCCCDMPGGKVDRRFVGYLNEELCGVKDRWWNSERYVVFDMVIL